MANYVYLVQSRDGGELNDSEYQVVALTSSVEKAVAAARADFNAKYYFGDKPEYSITQFELILKRKKPDNYSTEGELVDSFSMD